MQKTTEFFNKGWKALTQDKDWWKPVLILGLVNCIPIIGQLIVLGYMYDWAKEASWGLERPLTHNVGDLGKRLKYGWFAFVVVLVWTLPCAIVAGIFKNVGGLGQAFYIIFEIGAAICAIIGCAAAVRSVIYERIMPGLEVKRIWNMAKMDPSGLVRAWAITLWGVLFTCIVCLVAMIPAAPFAMAMAMYLYTGTSTAAIAALMSMGFGVVVLLLIAGVVATIGSTLFSLLSTRAFGYWVGQFKPQLWGRASEPMPFERGPQSAGYGATTASAAGQASEASVETQAEDDIIDVTPEPQAAPTSENAVAEEVAAEAAEVAEAAEEVAEAAEAAAGDAPASEPAKTFEQKRMGGNAEWHTKWQ